MLAVRQSISRIGYRFGCKILPLLPQWPGEVAFIKLLNRQLSEELDDGLFDFLDEQILEVTITDLGIQLRVSKRGEHFVRAPAGVPADSTISANSADFLAIASGREDPDTLFFQRRLCLGGQTEIGLTVKNRLDALDRSRIPQWAQRGLEVIAAELATVVAN
ncbi:Predicted lipid carrier protein YhbT, contains SCP2 domain [Microbulbifer donghaiensis]|uniref:Ubiquinone biosynthesis accessory factor UbiT n=1 Tax=Microbulbifer donghaiensis TaxID=494016 RepID=A0A1M4YSH7_9GAMM|nr:SCP2 sterol-binding domain-containing protein [Microbulbifer donghaiensis]SHF08740.1 Predicted lipid carrier protein YhbT, contains SCP2 domain [Microbulbifer donghaiensis]